VFFDQDGYSESKAGHDRQYVGLDHEGQDNIRVTGADRTADHAKTSKVASHRVGDALGGTVEVQMLHSDPRIELKKRILGRVSEG
jgi:hypothetical protein